MSNDRRFPWLEVVLLLAIAGMIVVIAVPGILVSRRSVNESEAVGALRTLYTVEVSYNNRHPATGYTCSMKDLFDEGLVDSRLGTGTHSGYRFSADKCHAATPKGGPIVDYEWYADPINAEMGTRHFCTDQRKVIRASDVYSGHDCLTLGNPL